MEIFQTDRLKRDMTWRCQNS